MDKILHANDVVLAKNLLNLGVVQQGHTLAVDLQESALVHELLDGLKGGVSGRNSEKRERRQLRRTTYPHAM